MHVFSIRDIENLTGIKAHTLRIWEQRYSFLHTKRKESRHRFYDNEDLKYILQIAYLYKKGIRISQIACLGQEEIRRHALQVTKGQSNEDIYINQLTEASIDFDQSRFDQVFRQLTRQFDFERIVLEVMFPLLNRIGLLWLAGDIRPAQEHFASASIIRQLLLAIDQLTSSSPECDRNIMVFAPSGEFHEIPLLFAKYLLKKNGIPHIYVGRNASLETLQEFSSQHQITELYFHLITNLLHCELNQYLEKLRMHFPDKKIIMSGSKLNTEQVINKEVRVLKSLEEMMDYTSSPTFRGTGE